MVGAIDYKKIMPSVRSQEEMRAIYYSYPGYEEKIGTHGLVAFDLE